MLSPLRRPPRARPFAPVAVAMFFSTLLAALLVGGCGSGSGTLLDTTPPSNLAYTEPTPTYTECLSIAPNVATVDGLVTGFSVSPPLPAGLDLDPATGELTGTPTAAAPLQPYTVTASGPNGSASLQLLIEVLAASAPADLAYDLELAVYAVDVPIGPNAPTFTGTASAFEVAPALPAGLSLDPATGVISGTPTEESAETTYTITASNCTSDSTTVDVTIEVQPAGTAGAGVPRFVFVGNEFDATLSRLAVDPATGQARHAGWLPVPGAPRELVASNDGTRLFALLAGTTSIGVWQIAANGNATEAPGSPFALPGGSDPRALALGPGGQRLYVSLGATEQVAAFAVAASGALTPLAGSPVTLPGTPPLTPGALTVSPLGNRLFVALPGSSPGSIASLALDGAGVPQVAGADVEPVGNGPRRLATVTGDGDELFLICLNEAGTLVSLSVGAGGALTFEAFSNLGAAAEGLAVGTWRGQHQAHVAVTANNVVVRIPIGGDGLFGTPTIAQTGGSPTAVAFSRDASAGFVLFESEQALSAGRFDDAGAFSPVSVDGEGFDRVRLRPGPTAIAVIGGASALALDDTALYCANEDAGDLSQYSFDAALDELASLSPPTVDAGVAPNWVQVHPRLARVYASDRQDPGGADLRVYPIGTGGPLGQPTLHEIGDVAGGTGAVSSIVLDPAGRFLFAVRNDSPGEVVAYALDATSGAPTFVATAPLGNVSRGAAVDPTGRFLYVVDASLGAPGVRGFRIAPTTGALTAMPVAFLPPASSPFAVAVHPSGRWVYTAHNGNSTVGVLAIDATSGELTPIADPIVATGGNPRDVLVEPLGRWLYVASQATNGVERLRIDPATGAPTLTGVAAPAGGTVGGLAVDARGTRLFAAVQSSGEIRLFGFDAAGDGSLSALDATPSGAGARNLALRRRYQ